MPDSNMIQNDVANAFKEAVCINAGRIYDSCSDKDCLEDLQCFFTPLNQAIIDNANSIKVKSVQVSTVLMNVEPIVFNKGFYSVDMTFYFLIKIDALVSAHTPPVKVEGISAFSKKVILYGSEGSVNTFCSDNPFHQNPNIGGCSFDENLPRACVNVVDPVVLAYKLCDSPECMTEVNFSCPEIVSRLFDDEFDCVKPKKVVCISLGLFSIVQLERQVQMMVPVYDFCIPNKECISSGGNDDPCELFKKIKFPVNEFFPPHLDDLT